jgi:hypothetical protein
MIRYNPASASHKPRRGIVAVLVALCLTLLVGIVAIAVDGGLLFDSRRQVQAAADAAALAAAADLYYNYPTYSGSDHAHSARDSAISTATANGFTNGDGDDTVVVNIPPSTGPFQGEAGYVEVIITYNQPRYFSGIFGSGSIPVKARAVARGQWTPFNDGVIVLHPTSPSALEANGNGDVKVQNASIIVDSNNSQAATTVGNAFVADPTKPVAITGNNPGYSGDFKATMMTGQPATPDPLGYLPVPDYTTMTSQTAGGGQSVSLQPGYYSSGLHFSGQQSVTMAPGIYYVNGSFTFSGQGTLSAIGVMVYATGGLSITGNGSSTQWSPPTEGIYTGISYFQARNSSATAKIAGNGFYNVTGTVYAAGGLADVQGNGDASIASQVVSLLMTAGGNGVTNIVWAGPPSARTRILQLVE